MSALRSNKQNARLPNVLCVDVEEWYHPEFVRSKSLPNRVSYACKQTRVALNLLREFNVKATFFVVGEIAEESPGLLKAIVNDGHEVAFHGYHHNPLWTSDLQSFKYEVERFNSIVFLATGQLCWGFRAPSYSLDNRTKWALRVLKDSGFLYDSSVFPLKTPLYGEPLAPIIPYHPSSENIAENDDSERLFEFPALVYPLLGFRIPVAGGFFLRVLPLIFFRKAINRMNQKGFPAVVSFHTWELDGEIPRLKLGPTKSFVTYHNLKNVHSRLSSLLSEFKFTSFRRFLEGYPYQMLDPRSIQDLKNEICLRKDVAAFS